MNDVNSTRNRNCRFENNCRKNAPGNLDGKSGEMTFDSEIVTYYVDHWCHFVETHIDDVMNIDDVMTRFERHEWVQTS